MSPAIILSVLATGIFLYLIIRNDFTRSMVPVAAYSAKGAVFTTALMALSFCIGLLLSHDTKFSVFTSKDLLVICSSTLLTILIFALLFKETSAVQALVGGVLGRWLYLGGDAKFFWQFPLGWAAACIIAGMLAYIFYSFLRSRPTGLHLFREMPVWGLLIMLASTAMAILSGLNLSPVIGSLNLIKGGWMIPSILAILIFIISGGYFSRKSMIYAEDSFDASPASAFSMVMAVALTLALFSFPIIKGMPRIPLSPFLLLISAAYACRISGGRINTDRAYRFFASLLLCPAIAALQAYSGLTGAAVALFLVLLLLFLDNLQARRIKSERLKENTGEMSEIAHRVNELQIRAMQQENTHLQNLLAVRRSQIIDDAEKISEHQRFISEVYNYIGKIEASPEKERNAMLRDLRTKLRLRMNHSEGLEKFYAKTETLHKDFNARLIDKYPQLTPQERRLATLLRLGFSTKYMASLLGISESSVEVGRHRMRKKLGLARKDKLTDFIKNI